VLTSSANYGGPLMSSGAPTTNRETGAELVSESVGRWATAVVFVDTSPEHFHAAVRSVLDRTELDVVVGVLYPIFAAEFANFGPRVSTRPVGSVAQLINETFTKCRTNIVVVHDAIALPPDPFENAKQWLENELRFATVSFLSNAAEFLSFPNRNVPEPRPPDGHDETSVTRRLRALSPLPEPAPCAYAPGPVVVLSAVALAAVGDVVAPASARFDVAIADFCARARAKGFIDVVDTSTYVSRTADIAVRPIDDTLTHDDRGWLLHRHPSLIHFLDRERNAGESAFAIAHRVARAKLRGLTVLVDGSCFGPNEVGTQVATLHTIRALANHSDVRRVTVAVPGAVPSYAASVLTDHPKVSTIAISDVHAHHDADVAFRPYQPTPGWDIALWKATAPRLVISVLDTIAFHNGGYFSSSEDWLAYRDHLIASVRAADLVTVISDDVIGQMRLHGFPISDARLHSVALGTEHLNGDVPLAFPAELEARGFLTGAFALCLGVNYTHKNREIARRAHELVREAGHDVALVFAGASVPHGSTRLAEARQGVADHVFVLPELSSPEKNWLLRHAEFVWYPTSAEGFGLVPFEAAAFETPTVAVDFGPLHELLVASLKEDSQARDLGPDVPLLATGWDAPALADVAIRFLRDPDLARRHTDAVRVASQQYSWARTAESFVTLFRSVLASPGR
jgi:glycosyltransferase involved in cell wall biosynthesis